MISLLLPTRGRRQLAEHFISNAYSKSSRPEQLEIIVYTDEDDLDSHDLGSINTDVTVLTGPRVTMGQMYISCLRRSTGDIIILANDDVEILTTGWDTFFRKVHATYIDGIYLAYPDDLYKRRATFPIISKKCAEILQEPYPAEYLGAFIDTHLFDLFQRVKQQGFDRVHFLRDVQFEHRHYRAGKSKRDSTYLNKPRLNGDIAFLSLIGQRVRQSAALLAELQNRPMEAKVCPNQRCPTKVPSRILFIIRNVAFDRGLPYRWRAFIAAFLIARAIASKFYKEQSHNSTNL